MVKQKSSKKPSGVGEILFTKTQRRVLALLFGHPDRRYYGNQLIDLAGVGIGAVRKFLQDLLECGLITVTKEGNQKYYQANHETPIFQELRSLVVKTFGVADLLKDAFESIEGGVCAAFIYGSLAKGTEQVDSDIDLFVITEGTSYLELMKLLTPLTEELGRDLDLSAYGKEEFATKLQGGNHFLEKVLSQPKIMLVGTEDDLEELGKHRPAET